MEPNTLVVVCSLLQFVCSTIILILSWRTKKHVENVQASVNALEAMRRRT